MSQGQSLTQEQKLTQRLSQSQVRYVRMLEMNAPEFDEAVAAEVEANPALQTSDEEAGQQTAPENGEFNETQEQLQSADYVHPDDNPFPLRDISPSRRPATDNYQVADTGESLYDYLTKQLGQYNLTEAERTAALFIIGDLDSNGYLTRSTDAIADDMLFDHNIEVAPETLRTALITVQALDPAGVGATDLRECLLLQLERMPASPSRDDALLIIRDFFLPFSMKHYHKIISGTKMSQKRLEDAVGRILSLNPKPGGTISSGTAGENVAPDFILENEGGTMYISLANRIPELSIRQSFKDAIASMGKRGERNNADADFVNTRYNEAREFIGIIRRRQETLYRVIRAILKLQKDYFETEDENNLRPMALKDVAAEAGIDIPTASRATNNKYLSTPWGIFPLRFFFSEKFSQEGEEVSGREIEAQLRKAVENEDKRHPLSDDAIAVLLQGKGYAVSRRTVSKYRDRLKIPVARLRKSLS